MASCPRCGEKSGGFFRLCGACEFAANIPDRKEEDGGVEASKRSGPC